jgi:hypothetical protein
MYLSVLGGGRIAPVLRAGALTRPLFMPGGARRSGVALASPAVLAPPFGVARAQGGTSTAQADNGTALTSYAANTPRFDGTGSRLLVEPAATNLVLWSNDLSNPAWSKAARVTGTVSGSVVAPDGTFASVLTEDGTVSSTHFASQSVTVASGTTYTISAVVKAGTRNWGYVQFPAAAFTTLSRAYFNATTGAWGNVTGSIVAATPVNLGNGWWRFSCSLAATANVASVFGLGLAQADNTPTYDGLSLQMLSGGVQIEATSYRTSYIPTTTAALARADDSITASVASVFPNSKGTIIAGWTLQAVPTGVFPISVGLYTDAANYLAIYGNASGTALAFWLVSAGATTFSGAGLPNVVVGSEMKVAFSFDFSGAGGTHTAACAALAGGVSASASGSGLTFPALSTVGIGRYGGACVSPMSFGVVRFLPYALSAGDLLSIVKGP